MRLLDNVKKYSDLGRLAVVCDGEKLTYKELDEMSDSMATYLINEFGQDKSPIVIYGNKDNLILVLMLAALKSGRAYVPLDVTFPIERVKQVINEVEAKVVINFTEENLEALQFFCQSYCLSRDEAKNKEPFDRKYKKWKCIPKCVEKVSLDIRKLRLSGQDEKAF